MFRRNIRTEKASVAASLKLSLHSRHRAHRERHSPAESLIQHTLNVIADLGGII